MKSFKRLIIGVTVLSFSVVLFDSCDDFETNKTMNTPSHYLKEPAKIISIKQAKNMYDIYTKKKVTVLKEGATNPKLNIEENGTVVLDSNFNPTRYVEYSLEDIKHYIAYIENEAKLADVEVGNLRVYLGAYPIVNSSFESGDTADYNRQESILILPTTLNKENGEQQGFFKAGDANGGKRHPVFMSAVKEQLHQIDGKRHSAGEQLINSVSEAAMFNALNTQGGEHRSLIMNRGNVVPPPKKDDDLSNND